MHICKQYESLDYHGRPWLLVAVVPAVFSELAEADGEAPPEIDEIEMVIADELDPNGRGLCSSKELVELWVHSEEQ